MGIIGIVSKEITGHENRNSEAANEKTEKNASISTLHGKKTANQSPKPLSGDEVNLCTDTHNIGDGASAKIKIVEKDNDGNDDFVTELNATVNDGKIRCDWKVIYTEDNDDTDSRKEMEEEGYTLPEYAFTVECDGIESKESEQLDVMGWIKTQLINKRTGEIMKNKDYKLKDENNNIIESGKTDLAGYIYVKDLKIGNYKIVLEF